MKHLQKLIQFTQDVLDELRKETIGLFYIQDATYLVLEYKNDLLLVVHITEMGALRQLHIDVKDGIYKPIPLKYESLYTLLQLPSEYTKWMGGRVSNTYIY